MKTKILLAAFCLSGVLYACSNNQEEEKKQLNEILAVHDKVMGEMIDGKVANSRIGLISSDDSGSILGRVKPTPIYTTDITDISIYKP